MHLRLSFPKEVLEAHDGMRVPLTSGTQVIGEAVLRYSIDTACLEADLRIDDLKAAEFLREDPLKNLSIGIEKES